MNRRDLLASAASGALFIATARAQEPPKPAAPAGPPDLFANGAQFSREALQELARAMAGRGFEEPKSILPSGFAEMPLDVYRTIQPRPDREIWANEQRGFTLAPLPGGFIYRQPIRIGLVEDGAVVMQPDEPGWFDFGKAPQPPADKPFPLSGFLARAALDQPGVLREFFAFQGATIFRALARGQIFGCSARGLAIDVAEQNGEEFPLFRALWIERPGQGADALTVHALLDSRRATGAYRFLIRPGEITTIDVEMTLFAREKLGHVGVAPMTSMFLFGPNDRIGYDDVRGEVHRSDGLQIWHSGGEWVWRPVTNPAELQISVFGDNSPRGFGLFQRERGFRPYNDLNRRYDRMPSLWIQPIGDWGEGHLQLVEIPTDTDIHENIVAYWRPKAPLEPGKPLSMSYRMHWCWSPPDRAGAAFVAQTASGTAGAKRRRFVVDFQGDAVADPARAGSIKANVSTNVGAIRDVAAAANPDMKGLRVSFTLDPGDETLCELRLTLDNETGRIGETWLYRWTA